MALLRPLLIALPTLLIACGDDGQEPPSGPHYTYVADTAKVPTTNVQANEYGLDLDGDKVIDNALGKVLATLATQGMFDIQGAVDLAVADGSIILLLDLQTPSFSSAGGAGLQIKLGDMPMPAPCTDPAMPATCGKHLDGNGSFVISTNSPSDAGVVGKISGGTFNGGPGDITLQIALGGDPVNLTLIGARAKATGMSESGMTEVILAGALTKSDLDNEVFPAIHTQLVPVIETSCPDTAAMDCGCPSGTGRTILNLFDTMPKDCRVSLEEITTNSLITSLTAPDVEIDGQAALSLGIKVSAKKATIR